MLSRASVPFVASSLLGRKSVSTSTLLRTLGDDFARNGLVCCSTGFSLFFFGKLEVWSTLCWLILLITKFHQTPVNFRTGKRRGGGKLGKPKYTRFSLVETEKCLNSPVSQNTLTLKSPSPSSQHVKMGSLDRDLSTSGGPKTIKFLTFKCSDLTQNFCDQTIIPNNKKTKGVFKISLLITLHDFSKIQYSTAVVLL